MTDVYKILQLAVQFQNLHRWRCVWLELATASHRLNKSVAVSVGRLGERMFLWGASVEQRVSNVVVDRFQLLLFLVVGLMPCD